ncbi:MAG TPA: hypothetical protein VFQ16_06145 [Burkholderiaceae bacterium]|nr:hypothetical protein [Burkholderiaceae bacterium]
MSAHGRSEALTDRSAEREGGLMRAHGRSEALTDRSAEREGGLMRAHGRSEALTDRSAEREGGPACARPPRCNSGVRELTSAPIIPAQEGTPLQRGPRIEASPQAPARAPHRSGRGGPDRP